MDIKRIVLGPCETNCYILTDDKTGDIAVIDPGLEEQRLINFCKSVKDKMKLILLTHGHFDHVMGVFALKELTGAAVAIHKLDAAGLYDTKQSMYAMAASMYHSPQKAVKPDVLLEDGDTLTLGGLKIRVLHTPGHTVGGVCYLTEDVIFSGDTLFQRNIGRTDFPGGDYGTLKKSLERLKALDGDYRVFPGHGKQTTLAIERKTNPYMGTDDYDTFDY